jgi:hypothetical protein
MTVEIDPVTLNALRYITGRVNKIELDVRSLTRQSGAAFQSIESGDGAVLIYDDDGNVIGQIGSDGIGLDETVLGPPQPEPPDVEGIFDALVISYDGTFTDGDWEENLVDHVEIHAVENLGDPLDDTTQIGTFVSSNGGVFTYPWHALDGGRWIYLVAVTLAGEEGSPSDGVLGVPLAVGPTDGDPPGTAPTVTVRPGVRSVVAAWPAVANADPLLYRVYAKSGSAPSVVGTTDLFLITPQSSVTINSLPSGISVDSTAAVHVIVIPFDDDGDGPASTDASATPIQIATIDIGSLVVGTTQIAADAITSPKIAANTIVAGDIAANTITSNEIAANTIVAADIAAGAITAAEISSNTITAAQIASHTITATQIAAGTITATEIAANTITAAELAAGAVTAGKIAAGAIDGITITGTTVQTASSGNRMVMRDDGSAGILEFFTGIAGGFPGNINPGAGSNRHYISIASPYPSSGIGAAAAYLLLQSADTSTAAPPRVLIQGGTLLQVKDWPAEFDAGIVITGGYDLAGGGSINGGFTTNADIEITGSGNTLQIDSAPTTTNAANVRIGAAGLISEVTSLSRFKLYQQAISLDDAMQLLNLTPRTWYDRAEVRANNDDIKGLRRIPGFVAEDVQLFAPTFADYDDEGKLSGVLYDRFAAAELVLIKDLYHQIETLQQQVASMA